MACQFLRLQKSQPQDDDFPFSVLVLFLLMALGSLGEQKQKPVIKSVILGSEVFRNAGTETNPTIQLKSSVVDQETGRNKSETCAIY